MNVTGAFHFHKLNVKDRVSLTYAKVGRLIDDIESLKGIVVLNGFVYDGFSGYAPTDAKNRLIWLDKQFKRHSGLNGEKKDFKPQPWQQLQKVLHEMGHNEDARQVAIAFEDRLCKANLIGQSDYHWLIAWIYQQICCFFHYLFGLLIGYGYRPLRFFLIMLFVWLASGGFYFYAAYQGVFAPSNPLVFQNSDYDVCKADNEKAKIELAKPDKATSPPIQGAGNWYLCEKLREEYTGFSPFMYSMDLILPLVDLQQEHDWSPMIPTPKFNV
jgi:hypothetical protein